MPSPLLWVKVQRVERARKFETPLNCLPLAPICRSSTGSYMPVIEWLQYADHGVAPICRSVTLPEAGMYMPLVRIQVMAEPVREWGATRLGYSLALQVMATNDYDDLPVDQSLHDYIHQCLLGEDP